MQMIGFRQQLVVQLTLLLCYYGVQSNDDQMSRVQIHQSAGPSLAVPTQQNQQQSSRKLMVCSQEFDERAIGARFGKYVLAPASANDPQTLNYGLFDVKLESLSFKELEASKLNFLVRKESERIQNLVQSTHALPHMHPQQFQIGSSIQFHQMQLQHLTVQLHQAVQMAEIEKQQLFPGGIQPRSVMPQTEARTRDHIILLQIWKSFVNRQLSPLCGQLSPLDVQWLVKHVIHGRNNLIMMSARLNTQIKAALESTTQLTKTFDQFAYMDLQQLQQWNYENDYMVNYLKSPHYHGQISQVLELLQFWLMNVNIPQPQASQIYNELVQQIQQKNHYMLVHAEQIKTRLQYLIQSQTGQQ
ncbi:hypothetical protein MP228_007697 [Amoeboaphelidium protococcarum]|nr:hypothetical protein MP228_007697 [Amoeboaphelidium protococcarum]